MFSAIARSSRFAVVADARILSAVSSFSAPMPIHAFSQQSTRWVSNARTEFEDKYHLGRSLSKFDISPAQQTRWEKKMSKNSEPWTLEPLEHNFVAGYEAEALQKIHKLSFDVNVLLEIRDVRLPASTHNPSFTRLAKHRLHLICYTHADMIDSATRDKVEAWTLKSWPKSRSIFVDTRENRTAAEEPFDLLYDSLVKHLESKGGMNVALTVGVANTGKSSLLLCLIRNARKRGLLPKKLKASMNVIRKRGKKRQMKKAGTPGIQDKPGKTKEITEYMLREKPRVFFMDVPGMTPPSFFFKERPEAWFGMAAANLIPLSKDTEKDPNSQIAICDYVLTSLNANGNFGYVSKLGMNAPSDDIIHVLSHLAKAKKNEDSSKLRLRQSRIFLKFLNTGNLGSAILDDIRRPYRPFVFKDSHFQKKDDRNDDYRSQRRKEQKRVDDFDKQSFKRNDFQMDDDDMEDYDMDDEDMEDYGDYDMDDSDMDDDDLEDYDEEDDNEDYDDEDYDDGEDDENYDDGEDDEDYDDEDYDDGEDDEDYDDEDDDDESGPKH